MDRAPVGFDEFVVVRSTALLRTAWLLNRDDVSRRTVALSVAAGMCFAAVDRRGGWPPRRDTRPLDEPPAA